MKPSGLILFLFNPSGDDKFNVLKFSLPIRDFNSIDPLLLVILIETKDNYLSLSEGIISANFFMLSSPSGFLSRINFSTAFLAKYLIIS